MLERERGRRRLTFGDDRSEAIDLAVGLLNVLFGILLLIERVRIVVCGHGGCAGGRRRVVAIIPGNREVLN
jgi:hypothetical protein